MVRMYECDNSIVINDSYKNNTIKTIERRKIDYMGYFYIVNHIKKAKPRQVDSKGEDLTNIKIP